MHLVADEEIEALEVKWTIQGQRPGIGDIGDSSVQPLVPSLAKVGTFSFLLIGRKE